MSFVTGLSGVAVVTASQATGAPEEAWGDSFFFYDPDDDPANRRIPFATIVTTDYDGDSASDLNRPGVFRVNIAVGRTAFERLIGYPPAAHADQAPNVDYTTTDRILPHPVYAAYGGWICIVNPGEATADQARALLTDAHTRAVHHRRPGA